MGVKYLWSIIEPTCQEKSVAELFGKKVAIDLACWVVTDNQMLPGHIPKPHLRQLFFRSAALIESGIEPLYVLEGKAPELKAQTIARRNEINFGSSQVKPATVARTRYNGIQKECIQLLNLMGVPTLQSETEAEALCAALNQRQVVDGCITKDGDTFLYGASRVFRNLSCDPSQFTYEEYEMDRIVTRLNLSRDKLIVLAILLGCDYLPDGVPGVKKDAALRILSTCSNGRAVELLKSWMFEPSNSKEYTAPPRPPHCSKCKHPGSLRGHAKSGCPLCKSVSECRQSDEACTCDWHANESHYEENLVKSKVSQMDGEVIQAILDEFFNGVSAQSETIKSVAHWQMPDVRKFTELAVNKLKWNPKYAAEKILPVLTRWVVTYGRESEEKTGVKLPVVPMRTIKKRIRRGCPMFEVEWQFRQTFETVQDFPDTFISLEPLFLLQKNFNQLLPEVPEKPMKAAKKATKKAKAPGKAKTAAPTQETDIMTLFQKMNIRATAAAAATSDHLEEDDVLCNSLLEDELNLTGGTDDSDISLIVQTICDRKTGCRPSLKSSDSDQDLESVASTSADSGRDREKTSFTSVIDHEPKTVSLTSSTTSAPSLAIPCPVGNFSLNFSLSKLDASTASAMQTSIVTNNESLPLPNANDSIQHQSAIELNEVTEKTPIKGPCPFEDDAFSTPLPLAERFRRLAV